MQTSNQQLNADKSAKTGACTSENPFAHGMIATIKPTPKGTKFSTSHRKENAGLVSEYAALVDCPELGYMNAVVTLRLYWPGSTTCYACIWTHGARTETYRNGSGKAGGYGYCKKSAAAGAAISNAGIHLSRDIDGRGEESIRDAVLAIAAAIGYPEAKLHVAHP